MTSAEIQNRIDQVNNRLRALFNSAEVETLKVKFALRKERDALEAARAEAILAEQQRDASAARREAARRGAQTRARRKNWL